MGELAAGAAKGSARSTTDSIRTRGQLSSSITSRSKSAKEHLDETLLDEDSDTETGGSKMEIDQAGNKKDDTHDVFEDDVSKTVNETAAELEIGGAHATIKAARRVASSRRQLNPAPSVVERASFHTSFTYGGDECILHCNISHNLKDRTSTSLSFDSKKKNLHVMCVRLSRGTGWKGWPAHCICGG